MAFFTIRYRMQRNPVPMVLVTSHLYDNFACFICDCTYLILSFSQSEVLINQPDCRQYLYCGRRIVVSQVGVSLFYTILYIFMSAIVGSVYH